MRGAYGEPPSQGSWITVNSNGDFVTPDNPIIGYIEGDGVGPDIWAAARPVFDAAVDKVSQGKRKIWWWEIAGGEKSAAHYGEYLPTDTRFVRPSLL